MNGPITVDDPADPRLAAYRDVRERDLVGREGLFIAEGEGVLRTLLSLGSRGGGGHEVASVLIAASHVASRSDLLARVPDGVPVYAASQPVMDAVVALRSIAACWRWADGLRRSRPSGCWRDWESGRWWSG